VREVGKMTERPTSRLAWPREEPARGYGGLRACCALPLRATRLRQDAELLRALGGSGMLHVSRRRLGPAMALAVAGAMLVAPMGGAAVNATALPLAGIVIAVDPGHDGGNSTHLAFIHKLVWIGNRWKACDTVGTTTRAGYPEHRFTFVEALAVKARLQALGATVYLTRSTDTGAGPCINVRGQFGARVHAALTVSIHGDGAPTTDHGFFVMKPGLVRGYTDDIQARSSALAVAIRSGLIANGVKVANYYARDGIISRTDLGTLNMSNVPAVMIELGNMKNSGDARLMTTTAGRSRYAAGIVEGIRRFLRR
jgi:N-acetylmuramoyl-L-alanine amidase